MQRTIKLAKHNSGKIIHVDDALNGLACDCNCPECGERLQAVHPLAKQTHFRHHHNLECSGGPETALHLFAKQIILDNSQMVLPGFRLNYVNPSAEVCLGPITPDLIVEIDGDKLHIEIAVTHHMTIEKMNYYKYHELKAVEINLSNIPYDFDKEEIRHLVLEDCKNKRIIFWEKTVPQPSKTEPNDNWIIVCASISAIFIFPKVLDYVQRRLRL